MNTAVRIDVLDELVQVVEPSEGILKGPEDDVLEHMRAKCYQPSEKA